MAKSDPVVIPFPADASPAPVDRPTSEALPALPQSGAEHAWEDANRALLNDLILQFCRTQAQRRKGHD